MERNGFIRRQPDPDDQRVSRVFLDSAGQAVKSQVEQVWQSLEAETFANLSPDDKGILRRLLLQLRENLLQATGEEPWK